MRRRSNQRRQRSLHQFPLHRPDPDERIRHRRPPHIQLMAGAIRRRMSGCGAVAGGDAVLMEAAPEGARVRGRRAHARLLRQRAVVAVALLLVVRGDRMPPGGGESHRRRRRDGSAEADTGRARGAGEDRIGAAPGIGAGGEGGGGRRRDGGGAEAAGGRERALEVAVEGCTVRGSVTRRRFHWLYPGVEVALLVLAIAEKMGSRDFRRGGWVLISANLAKTEAALI